MNGEKFTDSGDGADLAELETLANRYFTTRLMFWRDELDKLDAEGRAAIVAALASAKNDMADKLIAEAERLAALPDWRDDQSMAFLAWHDKALERARNGVYGAIARNCAIAFAGSMAEHYAALSFEGEAQNVKMPSVLAADAEKDIVGIGGMSGREAARKLRTMLVAPVGGNASWSSFLNFVGEGRGGLSLEKFVMRFSSGFLAENTLAEWIRLAFQKGVSAELLRAIARAGFGGNADGKSLRGVLMNALDDGFKITERTANTLLSTWRETANRAGQDEVEKANPELIYAREWITRLDQRVCPRCAALDGNRYKLDEKTPPIPIHPNCRCQLKPLARIKELGIDSANLGRVT